MLRLRKEGGCDIPLKDREKRFVTLRSRGNEVVRVVNAGDRALLEQADKLVLELTKRIEDKTVDPAMPYSSTGRATHSYCVR